MQVRALPAPSTALDLLASALGRAGVLEEWAAARALG